MSYRIQPIKLRAWFPADDPVASAVARLCILREDLLLELMGVVADGGKTSSGPEFTLEDLDANDQAFRRMYFWRNSLRTLHEIRDGLNEVNAQPRFRTALAQESADVQAAFQSLKAELNKTSQELLGNLRNTIGAHLDRDAIQAALDVMEPLREGLLEMHEMRGKTHYKFAAELLLAVVLRDVPYADQLREFERILGKSSQLTRAIKAIDDVFTCYARTVRQRRPLG